MATLKEVQLRIEGVKNTQKITRAMKIVAATKLKKWEKERKEFGVYAEELEKFIQLTLRYTYHPRHSLLASTSMKKVGACGLVVIASDRGLCGSFNSAILRQAADEIKKVYSSKKVRLVLIGKRAYDFFKKSGYEVLFKATDIEKFDRFKLSDEISKIMVESFMEGKVDSWSVMSNKFHTRTSFGYAHTDIIPVALKDDGKKRDDSLFIYENDPEDVLEYLLSKYIGDQLYNLILESQNAEEFSRMMAMDQATENADELIGELTLFYNRTRQMVITKEISEIVGGAEALK